VPKEKTIKSTRRNHQWAFAQRGVLTVLFEKKPLPNTAPQLPKPEVPEADDDNVLDLTTHQGKISAIVEKWTPSQIWLRLASQTELYPPLTTNILEDHEISALQFDNRLLERIPGSQLTALSYNSTATLEDLITYYGSSDISTATAFPSLTTPIKTQLNDLDELTDFNDNTLGGWTKGQGARDIQFVEDISGGFYLSNDTSAPGDNHDGMILEKTFSVIPGMTYQFTIDARTNNIAGRDPNPPQLILAFDGIGPIYSISNTSWKSIASNRTVAQSATVRVSLRNLTRQWKGNDFSIDNFRVRRVE
jgi:hypothetical protein